MGIAVWIALASGLIALVTVGVMYWQARLQKSSAKGDVQDQFNSLIGRLADLLTELSESSAQPVSVSADPGAMAKAMGISNQLAVVGGQALGMLPSPPKPEEIPRLNWYAAYVLAITFENTWQVSQAKDYWDIAVEQSKSKTAAEVFARQGRARYFFARNDNDHGDCDSGRKDYGQALHLLRPEEMGHDGANQQKAYIYLDLAGSEYSVGDRSGMFAALWECFRSTMKIRTWWRTQQCLGQLFSCVAQNVVLDDLLEAPGVRPEEQQAFRDAYTQWQAQVQQAAAAQKTASNAGTER
jgi:hypothetical protein